MIASPTAEERLAFLHEVATVVQASSDLDEVLGPVLRLLSERMRLERAGLAVRDRVRGEIALYAAHGLTPAEVRRARWAPGEGVVGQVAATGRPQSASRLPPDPRAKVQEEAAFVCVPVRVEDRVLGTLSAWRPAGAEGLDTDAAMLAVIAGLLVPAAQRAIEVQERVAPADAEPDQPSDLVGRSKAMRAVYELIGQVAGSTTTALLRGESGTGKELVANAIHRGSERAGAAFVKVNCAALPESVIESELFGHERGAFTGAVQMRRGRFELAHGGTLFLDEIGDLSPQTQVKLLRVLQEGELERVGANRTLRVDVRIVAATSRDLEAMIDAGTFRADLYYRLNVFPIHVPALRERRDDILLLTDHFVEQLNRAHGRRVRRVATSAIDMLVAYHWPGNVRELENCVERAVLLAVDGVIQGHHLPPTLQTPDASGTAPSDGLKAQVAAFERDLVQDALKSCEGNVAKAARMLGVTERIMGLRVREHGIDPRRFKSAR